MLEIEQAMIFVQGGIKGYFYSHNNGFEVAYGLNGENKWRARPINTGCWAEFNTETAISFFNYHKLDLHLFQVELNQTLLTYSTYLRMELKKLENALGKETIDKAGEGWQEFGRSIAKTIGDIQKKQNFKVIK